MPKILEETNTKQKEQVENKDYSDYQIYLNKLLILLKNSPNESLSLECEKIWKWGKIF